MHACECVRCVRPAISLLSLACAALQVPAICYVCKCLYACVHVCMCVCVLVPTCACVRLWCVFLQCQTLTHFCVLHCTPSTVGVALVNWRFSQQMWAYFYRHPTMQTRQIVCVRVCVFVCVCVFASWVYFHRHFTMQTRLKLCVLRCRCQLLYSGRSVYGQQDRQRVHFCGA